MCFNANHSKSVFFPSQQYKDYLLFKESFLIFKNLFFFSWDCSVFWLSSITIIFSLISFNFSISTSFGWLFSFLSSIYLPLFTLISIITPVICFPPDSIFISVIQPFFFSYSPMFWQLTWYSASCHLFPEFHHSFFATILPSGNCFLSFFLLFFDFFIKCLVTIIGWVPSEIDSKIRIWGVEVL